MLVKFTKDNQPVYINTDKICFIDKYEYADKPYTDINIGLEDNQLIDQSLEEVLNAVHPYLGIDHNPDYSGKKLGKIIEKSRKINEDWKKKQDEGN